MQKRLDQPYMLYFMALGTGGRGFLGDPQLPPLLEAEARLWHHQLSWLKRMVALKSNQCVQFLYTQDLVQARFVKVIISH